MKPIHSYYKDFASEDFARDPYFREFVLDPESSHEEFWNKHIELNPPAEFEIEEAIRLVQEQHEKYQPWYKLDLDEKKILRENIYRQLNLKPNTTLRLKRIRAYVVAGVAGVIGAIVLFGYLNGNSSNRLPLSSVAEALPGETKEVYLPDSSIIILNSNSSIRYNTDFLTRKVLLKGNAFFKVRKLSDAKPFIVQAGNLSVQVYGTEFNVNARTPDIEVVLAEGSVKIIQNETHNAEAFMLPGERWKWNSSSRQFDKSKISAQSYAAWMQGRWIFEKTSLKEIAVLLKEYYDKDLEFSKARDTGLTISAVIPVTSFEKLLPVISETLELNFTNSKNKIIVH